MTDKERFEIAAMLLKEYLDLCQVYLKDSALGVALEKRILNLLG